MYDHGEAPQGHGIDTFFSQGLGIALVAAQKAQVPVTLIDASEKALDKGIAFAGKQQCYATNFMTP